MRILHVIPSAAARDGGPNSAVRAMARELARQGVEVTVATTDADGEGRLPVECGVPILENGVEFRYFPRSIPGATGRPGGNCPGRVLKPGSLVRSGSEGEISPNAAV